MDEVNGSMKAERKSATVTSTETEPRFRIERTLVRSDKKLGRNETCPCGSGNKAKKCHPNVLKAQYAPKPVGYGHG